jgi:hypothetical protein
MGPRIRFPALLAAFALGAALANSGASLQANSAWVRRGPDGRLVYRRTPAGDRILDFSYAGYMGGGVALPDVPVRRTVRPSGTDDDTPSIQAALDAVAALPLEHGFRGAVLLAPGTFHCAGTVTISAAGVVLRGSGSGADGGAASTLNLVGKPHLAVALRAPRPLARPAANEPPSAPTTLADAYVPSGALSFKVARAAGFAVGDAVLIRRPVTQAWVHFMQMDDLTRDGRPQTWLAAGRTLDTERSIAAIAGDTLTLDAPLSDAFDARALNPPGTAVVKINPAGLSQAGVEALHVQSPPQAINHTQPHFTALRIDGRDCWARDLVIDETMNSVAITGRRITLERVAVTRKALHPGSSKPAEFAPNGTQVLLDRCAVTGDNIWFAATGAGVAGPVVLLNCLFHGSGRAESHQRWSTGILYDNCRAPEGGIDLRNRGTMGSGHGWTMGWGVIWNCQARDYVVQNPPGALNWLIGSAGQPRRAPRPFDKAPDLSEGVIDSPGARVEPPSLYLAQLAERLGPQAPKQIGYPSGTIDP